MFAFVAVTEPKFCRCVPLHIVAAIFLDLLLRFHVAKRALSSTAVVSLLYVIVNYVSASEMTYIVSGGALNSTHSLTHSLTMLVNNLFVIS